MSLQTRLTINTVAITVGVMATVVSLVSGNTQMTFLNLGIVALNLFLRGFIKEQE